MDDIVFDVDVELDFAVEVPLVEDVAVDIFDVPAPVMDDGAVHTVAPGYEGVFIDVTVIA